MDQLGIALVALAVGVAAGVMVAVVRKPKDVIGSPDTTLAVVEARLEAQSAELRRIADAAGGRDLASEWRS